MTCHGRGMAWHGMGMACRGNGMAWHGVWYGMA